MNIYFIILICIYILNLGIELAKHGEEKTGEHNFFNALIGSAIGIILLYFAVKTGF